MVNERVRFVVYDITGVGGTVRAATSTANSLAERGMRVEIISIFGFGKPSRFALHPNVEFTPLSLRRGQKITGDSGISRFFKQRFLDIPSLLIPKADPAYRYYSLFSDLKLLRWISKVRGGAVVGTRLGFNLLLSRFRPRAKVMLQEHVFLDSYPKSVRKRILRRYRRADAISVITHTDGATYKRELGDKCPELFVIPNSAAEENVGTPWTEREKLVICVGRLSYEKGTDLLIRAFAQSTAAKNGWHLLIAGSGADYSELRLLIDDLKAHNAIHLLDARDDVAELYARSSIYVLPSRHEGFGIALVEAMRSALPVISFACPVGPPEIITDGEDGILVPPEDIDAMTAAIDRVADDEDLRASLGTKARESSERYSDEHIGNQWADAMRQLLGTASAADEAEPTKADTSG